MIRIVDDFSERFYNGNYTINRDALKIPCSDKYSNASLLHKLTEALANYKITAHNVENTIDKPEEQKKALEQEGEWLGQCFLWITHAQNLGLVIEHESMTSKIKQLGQENTQLKERIGNLVKLNVKLTVENKRLHSLLGNGRGDAEVGNVE